MGKKLQVALSVESWEGLTALVQEANEDFENGTITISDIVNELISTAKIDFRLLQAKHFNIRKSLRNMAAQKEIDIDSVIRALMELKSKGGKRVPKQLALEGAS